LYVLLRDEEAAGRIIVELDAFVRYNRRMTARLAKLERRMYRQVPQLLQRGRMRKPRISAS
jgi:hypothetical protein